MGQDPLPSIFEVLINSIYIMETRITATRLRIYPPDLLIRPRLGYIRILEFHRAHGAIAGEYRKAKAQIRPLTGKGGGLDHP
jgi:NTE family protein